MSTFEEAFKKTKKKHLEEHSVPGGEGEQGTSGSAHGGERTGSSDAGPKSGGVVYPAILKSMRESLDGIWGNVILQNEGRPRSLLFCGATHGEGVTFVAFHLSLFLSLEYGMKVLYVDTCVEKAGDGDPLYKVEGHPGLASYLLGQQPVEALIVRTDYENLYVIPAGSRETASLAGDIISGRETLEKLSHYCEQYFDLVIYDGLPASIYPSVIGFARLVDQVILVSRYAYSRREVVKMVTDKLIENNVTIGGIILNDREYPVPQRIYHYFR